MYGGIYYAEVSFGGYRTFAGTVYDIALSDSLSTSDNRVLTITLNKFDTGISSDVISKTFTRPESDSVSSSDAITKTPKKVFSESVTSSDGAIKTFGKYVADSITSSDVFSAVSRWLRAFADTVAIVDVVSKSITTNKADSVTIIDVSGKTVTISKSDMVTILDFSIPRLGKISSIFIILNQVTFNSNLSDTNLNAALSGDNNIENINDSSNNQDIFTGTSSAIINSDNDNKTLGS